MGMTDFHGDEAKKNLFGKKSFFKIANSQKCNSVIDSRHYAGTQDRLSSNAQPDTPWAYQEWILK